MEDTLFHSFHAALIAEGINIEAETLLVDLLVLKEAWSDNYTRTGDFDTMANWVSFDLTNRVAGMAIFW